MTESWRNVGKQIRHLRQQHQLTIRQLARGCGLSPNAISLLERGKVAPTIATLCKIASALGMPISSFFQQICPEETGQKSFLASNQMAETILNTLSPCQINTADDLEQTENGLSAEQGFLLCLNGCLEVESSDQSYRLEAGDRITLKEDNWYRWSRIGEEVATVVLIFRPVSISQKETGQMELNSNEEKV
ncbi:MAG: XRE family transcriptional regulator [Chloroflexi bacterium]|nr:MAG: XRE family transcriptional regulator [Chloroflexota bacterium]